MRQSCNEKDISRLAGVLRRLVTVETTIMEVCGTHTVSIFRNGLKSLFPEKLHLISGPGCPVCVTDQGEIDAAIAVAERENTIVVTYGDMLRVPGSSGSLLDARSRGQKVEVVTSAADALRIARENPDEDVVFLGIGFETTAPATASVILEAHAKKLGNFFVLCLHKRVPPALRLLAEAPDLSIDGFLLPGHVTVIIGLEPYRFLTEKFRKSCAVAGFEARDIMLGLVEILRQIRTGRPDIRSMYPRAVRPEGNETARKSIEKVFERSDSSWRGLGTIPESGYSLKEPYKTFDAASMLDITVNSAPPPEGCRCGDVLKGLISPRDCPLFATSCTPVHPVGPCMVSNEGSCSAYYTYAQKEIKTSWNA
ncbi:MAG: hydrogenase formation protein HypD [Thermovirgaceae bacterium]